MDILISILSGLFGGVIGSCFILYIKTKKYINRVDQKSSSLINTGNMENNNYNSIKEWKNVYI